MACGCQKNRATAGAASTSGTYRVMVSGRQVYESSQKEAADAVASRFASATVLSPGQTA